MSVHTESAFESSIEAHLVAHGWNRLAPTAPQGFNAGNGR